MITSSDFSKKQLLELKAGWDIGMKDYVDPRFTADQMREIRKGLEKGLQVSLYADLRYSAEQMMQIRKGMEKGLNVFKYTNPAFDAGQMAAIRGGLEHRVNVAVYAKPGHSAIHMQLIREALCRHLPIKAYLSTQLLDAQCQALLDGVRKGYDASIYANPGFSAKYMRGLQRELEQGNDISCYLKENVSVDEIAETARRNNKRVATSVGDLLKCAGFQTTE